MNRIAVERKLPLKRPTARGGNFASEILSALRIQASKVRVVFAPLRSVQSQGPLDLVHRSTPVGAEQTSTGRLAPVYRSFLLEIDDESHRSGAEVAAKAAHCSRRKFRKRNFIRITHPSLEGSSRLRFASVRAKPRSTGPCAPFHSGRRISWT